MITRLIFCAPYRVPISTISLRFDHNLVGVEKSIIVAPMESRDLFRYLARYDIDTNRFEHVHDREIEARYPDIKHWRFSHDPRNNWLAQQALKLCCLDYFDYDVALIHDPDTWLTKPYHCVTDTLNLVALRDTTEGSYDPVLPSVLGLQRASTHCFVTELMPMKKIDWVQLRCTVEQRHQKSFLTGIIDAVPAIPTLDGSQELKWFSEYEFLGNWSVGRNQTDFWFQHRFEFTDLADFDAYDPDQFNAMCDQSPGQAPLLAFDDWHLGSIPNHDSILRTLRRWYDV